MLQYIIQPSLYNILRDCFLYCLFVQFYKADSFGLKTLDSEGRVKLCTVAGVEHLDWPFNESVFNKCILTYLSVPDSEQIGTG